MKNVLECGDLDNVSLYFFQLFSDNGNLGSFCE